MVPPSSSQSIRPTGEPTERPGFILICEDNQPDVMLVESSLELHHVSAPIRVVTDGETAIRLFDTLDSDATEPCPSIVLLDLNLPRRNGAEILARMRQSPRCGELPVVIMTSSDSTRDREEVDRLGISHYFRKPTSYDEFMKIGAIVSHVLKQGRGK